MSRSAPPGLFSVWVFANMSYLFRLYETLQFHSALFATVFTDQRTRDNSEHDNPSLKNCAGSLFPTVSSLSAKLTPCSSFIFYQTDNSGIHLLFQLSAGRLISIFPKVFMCSVEVQMEGCWFLSSVTGGEMELLGQIQSAVSNVPLVGFFFSFLRADSSPAATLPPTLQTVPKSKHKERPEWNKPNILRWWIHWKQKCCC